MVVGVTDDMILKRGQCLVSRNGRHTLEMQDDGDLVLYRRRRQTWSTSNMTLGRGYYAKLDTTATSLVVYDSNDHVVWSSNTGNLNVARLIVQDDGNLVLSRTDQGVVRNRVFWSTGTAQSMI